MVPALDILFRFVVAERMGTIILSALVAHTAWHWMIDRFGVLRQFPWPQATAADVASANSMADGVDCGGGSRLATVATGRAESPRPQVPRPESQRWDLSESWDLEPGIWDLGIRSSS